MSDDEMRKQLDELFARWNAQSSVRLEEANKPTNRGPGVTDTSPTSPPSTELLEWLENRERALKCRAAMSENGDHILLKDSVVNPGALPEGVNWFSW